MTQNKRIGVGLALALCSTALVSCSQGTPSNQSGNASATSPDGQMTWNSKTEKQLRDAIAQAPANGLKPELFLKGSGQDGAALTQAAVRYAEALAHGYADPTKLFEIYTIPRPDADVRQGLMQAIQHGDVASYFNSLVPQTDEYKALSQAHLHYLQLASKTPNFQAVADGDPMKPGSHGDRVAALSAALSAMGYLTPSQPQQTANGKKPAAPAASNRYSPQLVSAVKRLQADFGLKSDGIVGGNTLAAVNLGPGGLARECAIAMEHLRWLERDPPKTRIDVNTASTMLDYWRDGQHVDRREVVAGEPDKQTPQIQAPIVNLVAYPTWTVPKSIAGSEISQKSSAWLQENNFVMKDGMYVQQSGPKNSLGLVKFDMDDKYAIYLHDTPAKALFGLPDRHRSHGCVRVQNAVAFANAIASEQGVQDQFQKAMASQDETFVKLKQSIPVRLMYQTAFWDGSRIQFRPDVYGWDDNVAAALGLVRGVKWQPVQQSGDIGP